MKCHFHSSPLHEHFLILSDEYTKDLDSRFDPKPIQDLKYIQLPNIQSCWIIIVIELHSVASGKLATNFSHRLENCYSQDQLI